MSVTIKVTCILLLFCNYFSSCQRMKASSPRRRHHPWRPQGRVLWRRTSGIWPWQPPPASTMSGSASDGSDSHSLISQLFEPRTIVGGIWRIRKYYWTFFFYPLPVRGKSRRYIWREGAWVGMKQNQLGIRIRKNSIRMRLSVIGVLDLSWIFETVKNWDVYCNKKYI